MAAFSGCNYFCTNVKITVCDDCGHIDKKTLHKCPECGSLNVEWATRIIGYLKKVKSFSKDRQTEHDLRFYQKTK
jgi:ribonucleoside-triphosphate reductase